ncbi:hypothetical protein [Enterocloster sp.]|uniref:hypothetical protein n=1 Tax=Enterocloster sp. TaxID=2719315 RepID=UPI0039A07FAD
MDGESIASDVYIKINDFGLINRSAEFFVAKCSAPGGGASGGCSLEASMIAFAGE